MGRPKLVKEEEVVTPVVEEVVTKVPVKEEFDPGLPENKQRHLR